MNISSDIIIIELLRLYFHTTDSNSIDISQLERGFYTLLSLIYDIDNIHLNYNFQKELKRFLETYTDITISEDKITLIGDIEELHQQITNIYETKNTYYELQDYLFDSRLFKAMNIPTFPDEVKEYFDLNRTIIGLLLQIGNDELNHKPITSKLLDLESRINLLKDNIVIEDASSWTKLKVAVTYLNQSLLPKEDEEHHSSTWYAILFSYNREFIFTLSYYWVEYLIHNPEIEDHCIYEINGDDVYFTEYDGDDDELDEIPYFITVFLISLIEYLKVNPNTIAKESLLIKKYLLLGNPELSHVKDYLLEYNSLDNYPIPPFIDQDEEIFECLKATAISCTANLFKENSKLNKPHILSGVITCALFIKTFLSTSINENSKKEIINLIANSPYYKKPSYIEASKIIDTIIFEWNPNLSR